MVSIPLRRPRIQPVLTSARLLLSLVIAFAIAVPVTGYIYAHHLVVLGAHVSTPAAHLPPTAKASEGDSGGTDTLPPANPFQLKALSSLGSTTTAQYIINAVTKAEKSGGLMQVVFHRICTVGPCRTNAIRIGVFTDVLNWLAAQRAAGAIQVKTVAQAIGGPLHPPVAAPRPTATLTVPNPSFETAGPVADVPSCWEHTVSGDGNVAAWSLVHGATRATGPNA